MTNLDCSVRNCLYNKDNSCSRDNIHVEGANARITEETSCKSFVERKDGAQNSTASADKATNVLCDATNCIYNEACHCDAEHIGIAGRDACHCQETECASFRSK